jgi:hypothetical protein
MRAADRSENGRIVLGIRSFSGTVREPSVPVRGVPSEHQTVLESDQAASLVMSLRRPFRTAQETPRAAAQLASAREPIASELALAREFSPSVPSVFLVVSWGRRASPCLRLPRCASMSGGTSELGVSNALLSRRAAAHQRRCAYQGGLSGSVRQPACNTFPRGRDARFAAVGRQAVAGLLRGTWRRTAWPDGPARRPFGLLRPEPPSTALPSRRIETGACDCPVAVVRGGRDA